ncbi:hypothetical protein [Bacillus taeanensis]|uniref:hypothetical protein n=1 Tax=Bacillus taeanensis TaxID=273032 RepID=UPI001FE9132B|nr:hypothetical protein [Bacillus taeanensis]
MKEYVKTLLESRQRESIKEDIINEMNNRSGSEFISPTTSTTTEDTRLLMEYMDRANLFNISKGDETRGKLLKLRKFLKAKRNQQVEVYSKIGNDPIYTEGKVSAVGRDFVMLTNLKERIWIPYSAVESANIPYGIPNYSNTHQHFIYDNNLRKKLLQNFGETVSKRDLLKQQFFEETLQTNLDSWRETWIEVHLNEHQKKIGKIICSKNKKLTLNMVGKEEAIVLKEVKYIATLRLLSIITHVFKHLSMNRR